MDYQQPDLSVITVNYNGFHDTCEFIDSWAATVFSVSYEMIVIDNGSTANEAALLQKTYPFIQAVRSERNLGFAGGNNLGINLAKGKYLFLLNNDVCMVKDAIPLLIKRLLSSDKIAGVSPLIRDYAEPHAIQFAGYTQLSPITLRNRAIGKGKINKDHYPAQKTPYLHGAAMLLKKTIIDKLSLMPEEYFLYYEELDWCTYINREGYELWYDPACEIWHKDSSSTGKESPLKYYYLSRNRLLYAYRNLFDWKLPVSILYQTMIVCPKNILTALGKGKKAIAKAHWEGTKAFFKLRNKDKQLAQYPITLLQARFKKSSKMKSVKAAMSQLQEGQYDIVLIMNADNVVDTNFLEVVNNTYASGSNAIQTHRIYQERPSNVSILNAITDEINNSILRAGHVNLGLSASLNGSGTAIDFTWFKENIRHLKDDDDEKVIESLLLRERIYVEYLNNTHVYALKNSGKKKFYTQHSTWIKTQYYSLFTNIGNLPGAILSGKFDYADRILQWFIFPRTILLGILLLFSFLSVYFHWSACLKWWGLLLTFLLTMAIATPNYLVDSKFNKAMKAIPFLAAGMIFNMLLRKKK